jgi:hypothetical protein
MNEETLPRHMKTGKGKTCPQCGAEVRATNNIRFGLWIIGLSLLVDLAGLFFGVFDISIAFIILGLGYLLSRKKASYFCKKCFHNWEE